MAANTALNTSFCFSFMRRGKSSNATATTNTTTTAITAAPGAQPSGTKVGEEVEASPPPQQTAQDGTNTAAAATAAATAAANPYESSIRTIATVSTVESFWEIYNFLKRPSDLPSTTDYHFFRGGIKPTWEDPSNAKGGKWIVRLPKGLASRYWEEMILALIGCQLSSSGVIPEGEICGAVLSVRYAEDILGVWNRTAADREMVERIRDAIRKCLQLPPHANMEYKPHQTSLADRSSFRNTQVWKPKSLEGRSTSMGDAISSSGGSSSSAVGGPALAPGPSGTMGAPRRSTLGTESKLKSGSTGGRWRNPS